MRGRLFPGTLAYTVGTSSRESPLWREVISDKCLAGLFKVGLRPRVRAKYAGIDDWML